jgi:hypothetical protein
MVAEPSCLMFLCNFRENAHYGHLTGVYSSVVDKCMYPLYSKHICTTLLLLPCLNLSFHVCQVRFR